MRFTSKARSDRIIKEDAVALVSGSFDPPTIGHLYLIEHAARKYRRVLVVVFVNNEKTSLFDTETRLAMLRAICARYDNVEVDHDEGYLYLYAQKHGVTVNVRGWRSDADLSYERDMAAFNECALPSLETELLRCPKKLCGVSSSAVRAALVSGAPVKAYVPPEILPLIASGKQRIN